MVKRTELQKALEELLGSKHVYFQPPETLKLSYPCIVYHRDTGDTTYSNNMPYKFTKRYSLTYITRNPDDPFVEKLAYAFQTIKHDRFYTSDNLNHDVYTLYF